MHLSVYTHKEEALLQYSTQYFDIFHKNLPRQKLCALQRHNLQNMSFCSSLQLSFCPRKEVPPILLFSQFSMIIYKDLFLFLVIYTTIVIVFIQQNNQNNQNNQTTRTALHHSVYTHKEEALIQHTSRYFDIFHKNLPRQKL